MDETIIGQDSATIETTPEPELELTLDETTGDEDTVESLRAKLAEKEALLLKEADARRQLTARAKQAEAKKPAPQLTEKHDDIRATVLELKMAETKRQYGYENGLSPEETDFVFKINSKPGKDTLDDVAIKGALQAIRNKKKVESNTPKASRSSGFQLPTKKGELTADDKEAAYEKYKKDRLGE
jgi:hypothetical protein